MKRVLSWIVLGIGNVVFACLAGLLVRGAFWLFELIYAKAESLFWVLVVLEGVTFIGFVIGGIVLGCKMVVTVSQSVWKSKRGARYLVFGILIAVLYLAVLIGLWADVIISFTPYMVGTFYWVMFMYGLALIFVGIGAVKEAGPPPTKRERLQAKLDALDKEEQEKARRAEVEQLKKLAEKMELTNMENQHILKNAYTDEQIRALEQNGTITSQDALEYAKKREALNQAVQNFPSVKESIQSKIRQLEGER